MYWMTLRQHRMQLLVTLGLLAAFGVVLLVHGIGTASATEGLTGHALEEALGSRQDVLLAVIGWFPVLPALIGVFWGAPVLSREYERGTHLLAWTQSVSRRRWVLTKLGVLALLVTLAGLALGLMVDAWIGVGGARVEQRFGDTAVFTTSGVAAAGWWLFAFMLGASAGALFRRLLPAMAVTIAVFVVALWLFMVNRGEYATPERFVSDITAPMAFPEGSVPAGGAWLDDRGVEVSDDAVAGVCADEGRDTYLPCMAEEGYRTVNYLHRADQYWRFQWTEAGLLLGAALVLGGVGYHRGTRASVR
ncbi:ABC transporter permease [Actinophytocola gossypii]|uniref:ABC transporter permease n=1 Tax=Actinophytocola gossypii TaxID=2812003 RepID=A0ABT2J685_9PSEU|nr:ABC transporter permease [Actinophytocola gossypii]MCT2583371.1 ABC transporter permease [Actinophytocola gossypii]